MYVFRSSTPLGPWYYAGDVGAYTTALSPFSKHDPLAYVTHAQASTVVDVNGQYVWLGNQWVTGATRNSDLLYWSVLNFDEMGNILQIKRSDKATIIVPSSSKASPTLPAIHDKKLKMQLKISIPTIALRGQIGHPIVRMPAMALGTAGYNDTIVEQAVLDAYANGFRAVHTAFDYFNAPGIARALRKLDRNEIFVIAMTSPCMHSASPPRRNVSNPQACTELTAREINATLKALNVKYVDLLLLHGPSEPFNYTGQCNMHVNALNQAQWAAYRDALEMGLAKSIGVSNFCQSCLAGLSPLPAINQIQWHVGMGPDPDGLVSWCVSRGIIVQAYSPLAAGAIVHDPLCTSVGKSIGHSSAEVGLRWVIQHKNTAVVVKSKNPVDMKNDLSVFGWDLSQDIVATLDRATEPKGQQDGRPSWGCGA